MRISCLRVVGCWLAIFGLAAARAEQPDVAVADPPTASSTSLALTLPSSGQPVDASEGSVTFVGNATVLIRFGNLTLLTDPNFLHKGDHVHLGYGLKAERLTNPAIEFDQLPPVDLVVLSHMHGDHFDQLVQEKLKRDIPIVTTPEASEALEKMGFTMRYPLPVWDSLLVKKGEVSLRVTAMPGRHGLPVVAGLLPQVMGSMLDFSVDGKHGYRMYISGDTLVNDDIREIPKRFPDVDLALLHLGGTRIPGLFTVTMDAKQGVKMLQIIAPAHAIPIHYNDYDVFKSPIEDFDEAVKAQKLEDRIIYLKHGETHRFPVHPK